MSDQNQPPWLEAARRAQAGLPPPAGDGPLAAGDLMVRGDLPAGTEELAAGIEWALVERDPAAGERYLAVPADGLDLRGSGDLAIGSGGLRRTLRCRHPLWLQRGKDSRWKKTGQLTLTELARARRQLQDLAAGREVGGLLGREVDETPDYREEIADPLAELVAALSREDKKPAPPPRPAASRGLQTWAVAASLLVAVLGFKLLQEFGHLEALRQEQEAARGRHAEEVQKLETDKKALGEGKVEAEQRAATASADLEATRQDLERARKESTIANPELAILPPPGNTRGDTRIELDGRASHLLLLIPLGEHPQKAKYRIELLGGQEPWISPELEVLSPGELRLGIPASLLKGETQVTLRLRLATESTRLADYELVLRRR